MGHFSKKIHTIVLKLTYLANMQYMIFLPKIILPCQRCNKLFIGMTVIINTGKFSHIIIIIMSILKSR